MSGSIEQLSPSTTERGSGKCIPSRFVFVGLSFCGVLLVYANKVVLSVAIVSMVGESHLNKTVLPDTCLVNETIHHNNDKAGQFDWDKKLQAIILGGFFYGYAATQLPSGVLSEKFSRKWIFGGSMLVAAILSMLAPIAAKTSPYLFLATRIGTGLADGMLFPCLNGMISQWMPKMERSRGSSFIFSGSQIGTVITLPLTGYLCASNWLGGWPSPFYVLGAAGFVWFVLWTLLVYENPDSHPYISQSEYDYIISDQGDERNTGKVVTPWISILTSVPLWALVIAHFGQNWGFLTILTLLPTYFERNSLWSSLPYLLQAIFAWISSLVSDILRRRQVVSITVIRKTNNTIAFISCAICLTAVALVKCNVALSIFFFVLGIGLNGCVYSGFHSTHVDMAPDFAATLMGMTNSVGNIPGFVAPLVAQLFYNKGDTLTNWSYVFYISSMVYVLTAIIFLLFGSAQLQSWGLSNRGETLPINANNRKRDDSVNHLIENY